MFHKGMPIGKIGTESKVSQWYKKGVRFKPYKSEKWPSESTDVSKRIGRTFNHRKGESSERRNQNERWRMLWTVRIENSTVCQHKTGKIEYYRKSGVHIKVCWNAPTLDG